MKGTLKERISSIKPVLEDLRLKKEKRIKDFSETQLQIGRICAEIAGNSQFINSAEPRVNERDLTLKKLGELKSQLQELQYEKVPLTYIVTTNYYDKTVMNFCFWYVDPCFSMYADSSFAES